MNCKYKHIDMMDSFSVRDTLLAMPINDFVDLIEFKDGVAEFTMVAHYGSLAVICDDMFVVVQSRQTELNEVGCKTFSIENKGWYQMDRTWYVWSKEKTTEREKAKNQAFIVLFVGLFIFLLILIFVLCRGV